MTWIGANRIQSPASWVWESSGLPLTYFNWHTGEPNNAGGNDYCVQIQAQVGGHWNDASCSHLPFATMCEFIYNCK
jgi:hypothetical protein